MENLKQSMGSFLKLMSDLGRLLGVWSTYRSQLCGALRGGPAQGTWVPSLVAGKDHARAAKPVLSEPVLGGTRSLCREEPGRQDERVALTRCIQRKPACGKEDPRLKEDPQSV